MAKHVDPDQDAVLDSTFFSTIWSLILDENVCEVTTLNQFEYFRPGKNRFDVAWAHGVLADYKYSDYLAPIDMMETCASGSKSTLASNSVNLCANAVLKPPRIVSLEIKHNSLKDEIINRQTAYMKFLNRTHPWYVKPPICHFDPQITEKLQLMFSTVQEMRMLQKIKDFNCKLMILDVPVEAHLASMEQWSKFTEVVCVVAVVRCRHMARKLSIIENFYTLEVDEQLEIPWHDELNSALISGLAHAKEIKLRNNCAEPFAFVFASRQSINYCNTFKILQKS